MSRVFSLLPFHLYDHKPLELQRSTSAGNRAAGTPHVIANGEVKDQCVEQGRGTGGHGRKIGWITDEQIVTYSLMGSLSNSEI